MLWVYSLINLANKPSIKYITFDFYKFRPEQDVQQFTEDTFECIVFLKGRFYIEFKFHKFVPQPA